MTDMDAAQCETCDGTGRVTITDVHVVDRGTKWQRSAEEQVVMDCPDCEGQQERTCGECTECCTVVKVDTFNKPAGVPCEHLKTGCAGCAIYDQRPHECKCFTCAWLDDLLPIELRPDRCGFVVESCWIELSDDTKLTMLVVLPGKELDEEDLELLAKATRHRTIVNAPLYDGGLVIGGEEDVAIYQAWLKAVRANGVIETIDCDGTITTKEIQ